MTIGIVFYRAISFFDGSTLRQDSVQALLATGLLFVIEIASACRPRNDPAQNYGKSLFCTGQAWIPACAGMTKRREKRLKVSFDEAGVDFVFNV
jgi:hypothetical protein